MSNSPNLVYISIPAYNGNVALECSLSLLNNIRTLERNGYVVFVDTVPGDCYIENARNKLCKSFLASAAENMIFVDNDLSFDDQSMLKLLKRPVEIIGGAYPYRDPKKKAYPCQIMLDADNVPIGDPRFGIVKAHFVPTGLLRISRSALEKMKDERWKDSDEIYRFFRQGMYLWDTTEEDKKDQRWYGEDVFFCLDANRKGVQVWLEPRIAFEHFGKAGTKGCYHEWLLENGIPEEEKKAA